MKKLITFALIAAMMLTMIVVGTSAAAWDGTTATAFTGTGTADDPYVIASAENLKYLQEKVNGGESYAGKYFKQTADLDLGGKDFAPIGNRDGTLPFCGLYDGNGYKITNFYQSFKHRFGGLFAFIITAENFTPGIINVTLEGEMDTVTRDGDIYAAALLGWSQRSGSHPNRILVANCTTDVAITFDTTGKANGKDTIIGGVFGRTGFATIVNCTNKGDLYLKGDGAKIIGGGIVGYQVDTDVINCVNNGKVTVESTSATKEIFAGGVIGAMAGSTIAMKTEGCINNGDVNSSSAKANYSGGITGCVSTTNGATIKNCANTAFVISESSSAADLPYAGGILGYTNKVKVAVENCYNSGEITTANENKSGHAPGGIAGVMNNSETSTYAKDSITTTASFKGWFHANVTTEGCAAGADAAVVAAAVKTIDDAVKAAKSVTLNGTTFNFVYPTVPTPPAPPVVPETPSNPNTGDVTSVIVLALVAVAAGAVLTIKKAR